MNIFLAKIRLTFLAVAGFTCCAIAQVPKEKALLWQVSGQGITKPSYLFGTIHLLCPNDLNVPETIKQKFGATSKLFL